MGRNSDLKRKAHRRWAEANPDKYRLSKWRAQLNGTYGKGAADHWEATNELQGGVCAICGDEERSISRTGEVRRLCLDHNHATGEWRGLLCANCNFVIGYAQESTSTLHAAIQYLESHA